MRKALFFFLVLFCVIAQIRAEKIAEFKEPFYVGILAMDESQIYIADLDTNIIHIYSRKDFRHIGQFGRKGQGPTDFESIVLIRPYPDFVYISAGTKVAYYSREGRFLKTATPFPNSGGYVPFGSGFVCQTYPGEDPRQEKAKIQVELLDGSFNKKELLYTIEVRKFVKYNFQTRKRDALLARDCFKLDVYDDVLYVGDTDKGFFFIVFDARGKKLYEINVPYEKREIDSKERKQLVDAERQGLGEQKFNQRKAMADYVFPRSYPAYSDFTVADGKIYVFSYPVKGRPQEITILDLKGNVLRRTTIPETSYAWVIDKGMYYYVKYNDGTNKWQLHGTKID